MKQFFSLMRAYFLISRLHKPIGTFLVLGPALWALWLASDGVVSLDILLIFVVGAFVMRSAGCVLNDIADRKIDKHVKRTKNRPLVAGLLTVPQALRLFFFWCLCAFILVLQLNLYTILLSCVSLYLVLIYPYTKRLTHWPQLFLGMAFASAVPMAYSVVLNKLNYEALFLFLITLIWAFIYDTEYAMSDREEDIPLGVRSTAILFGRFDRILIAFFMAIFIAGLGYIGYDHEFGVEYFSSLGVVCLLFIYQLYLIRNREAYPCLRAFYSNQWVSLVVFMGIYFSY